jgi:hypothetical protein
LIDELTSRVPAKSALGCVQPLATPLEVDPPLDGVVVVAPEVVVADVVDDAVVEADVVDAAELDADVDDDVDAGGEAADDDFFELPPQPAASATTATAGTSAPSARLRRGPLSTPIRSPPQLPTVLVLAPAFVAGSANPTQRVGRRGKMRLLAGPRDLAARR